MKRLIYCLFPVALHAAAYFVSSTGSDSNDGSQANPWLTLQHAVNSVACGDTINVVANGSFVAGDANLPFLPCAATTTIQSSTLASFAPPGYRTNPTRDLTAYGKLLFTGQGIAAGGETHDFKYCQSSAIDVSTNTFTISCNGSLPNLANGSVVMFEATNFPNGTLTYVVPSGITALRHYYVVNCSAGCGTSGSTFQISATAGGPVVALGTCDPALCVPATWMAEPITVDTSTNTLTSPDAFVLITNGSAITFGAGGQQFDGTLPAPLQPDTIYYVVNLSGRQFQVAATPGGAAIRLTTAGLGMICLSQVNVPHNWAFRGLELKQKAGSFLFYLILIGTGYETSKYSMVRNFEIDRCWFHDNLSDTGLVRAIADNGQFVNIHDSYLSGNRAAESQAIFGQDSRGPTTILNNFLEAGGENTLYGGNNGMPYIPAVNANKLFAGNYLYKAPVWKISTSSSVPSGTCLYDTTDPDHAGGEWYRNTAIPQNYQCGADFAWHTTTSAIPQQITVKNMAEYKSGLNFSYIGNLFNYAWVQAQTGQAIVSHNRSDSGADGVNQNLLVMNNKAMNVYQFLNGDSLCCGISGTWGGGGTPKNYSIVNNLSTAGDPHLCGVQFDNTTCGGGALAAGWGGFPLATYAWNHNTIVMPDSTEYITAGPYFPVSWIIDVQFTPPSARFDAWTIKNSIIHYNFNSDDGRNCAGGSTQVWATWLTRSLIDRLVVAEGTNNGVCWGSPSGAGNTITSLIGFPANNAGIGFVDAAHGDYHLAATSNWSAQNSGAAFLSDDGTDLGADIDLVNMAISGAAAGTPPWDQVAGFRVTPGSAQAVFRYTAPTTDACTATIYNAPARIAGNQVTATADSSASSISETLARELYVSGLVASTKYWYKLGCGGGVLLVGSFVTRARGVGPLNFTFDWSSPTAMQYSPSRDMSGATSLAAASRQFIPVAANSAIYVRVVATGSTTLLIAP